MAKRKKDDSSSDAKAKKKEAKKEKEKKPKDKKKEKEKKEKDKKASDAQMQREEIKLRKQIEARRALQAQVDAAAHIKTAMHLLEGDPGVSTAKPVPLRMLARQRSVAWQWMVGGELQYPIPIGMTRPLSPFSSE
mmetsp:Transcript_46582/g.137648  ORF Transcript_46582/g.137648 Transcript_46582/m.137648 type:complete len:135 (-) Transcript_46582:30-434(-)